MSKCKTCGQDRKATLCIFDSNPLSFAAYLDDKCKDCGLLPRDHPAVVRTLGKSEKADELKKRKVI